MADASRFPHLAPPFAIVGASAGWLSARFLQNPLVAMAPRTGAALVAGCAMLFAALTGAVLTRLCIGKRYSYEIDAPDPEVRPSTDRGWIHTGAVLLAGTATGAISGLILEEHTAGILPSAVMGLCCTVAFVPVCLAVLAAARRAQRARLGSIVAASDRRAVWAILATTLVMVAAGAVLEWPAAAAGDVTDPIPALLIVLGAEVVVGCALLADVRALRTAKDAMAPGLTESGAAAIDPGAATLDLGLGEGVLAELVRSASAYRGRDRAVALVQGSPDQALDALSRAVRRGAVGMGVVLAVATAHAVALTRSAERAYEEHQCSEGLTRACAPAAWLAETPEHAAALLQRGCDSYDTAACAALGRLYAEDEHVTRDAARVMFVEANACSDGRPHGCGLVADLFTRRDEPAATLSLLRQMCAQKDEWSCRAVADAQAGD
jgi:hypothetical protein